MATSPMARTWTSTSSTSGILAVSRRCHSHIPMASRQNHSCMTGVFEWNVNGCPDMARVKATSSALPSPRSR